MHLGYLAASFDLSQACSDALLSLIVRSSDVDNGGVCQCIFYHDCGTYYTIPYRLLHLLSRGVSLVIAVSYTVTHVLTGYNIYRLLDLV